MVEAIFVEEEGACGRLGPFDVLGNVDHVAAGTKAAPLGMIDQDDTDIGIIAPFDQRGRHVADHLAIEAVKRFRAIEAKAAGKAFLEGQDVGIEVGHQVHFIIA